MKCIAWMPRLLIGGLFLVAGAAKWGDPASLATQIRAIGLTPADAAMPLSLFIPTLELLLGAGLVAGYWRGAHWLGVFLLTAVFTVALARAAALGVAEACACFGAAFPMSLPWALARNTLILAVALMTWMIEAGLSRTGEPP